MRRRVVTWIVAAAVCAATVAVPSRARALEVWQISLIISGAVMVVGVIVGVAVASASADEPHFLREDERIRRELQASGAVRFTTQCRQPDGTVPLACW